MFEKIISKNPEEQSRPSAQSSSPVSSSQAPTPPSSQQSPSSNSAGQRNILSNDVEIKGKVRFENDLLVDGKIEGEIASTGSLTVAENAHIKAEIKTRSVIVYGKVHGNIIATERIEVKNNAELVGDVKAPILSIESGAIFVGTSEVGNPSTKPAEAKSSNQPPLSNENSKKPSNSNGNNPQNRPEQKELIGNDKG